MRPTETEIQEAAAQLADDACRVFDNPALRNLLIGIQKRNEITIDQVSVDEVKLAGLSDDATAQALNTVEWTTESLWRAYAQLERDKVRGVGAKRVLTDLVALVRHAVQLDDELVPYPDQVQHRYQDWLAGQESAGRSFTPEQRWWLDRIVEHMGVNLDVTPEDLDTGAFCDRGERIGAMRVFGPEWMQLLAQISEALAP